jgi:hypothetical protein
MMRLTSLPSARSAAESRNRQSRLRFSTSRLRAPPGAENALDVGAARRVVARRKVPEAG